MVQIEFVAEGHYENPYTEVDFWVDFSHDDGQVIRRPGFWDGGQSFLVRFASTTDTGVWSWESDANVDDDGLVGQKGRLRATSGEDETHFDRHGFWHIAHQSRWLEYADGRSAFMVADTPWTIPWRATPEEVRTYARDRQKKGFNAALLMSMMSDMGAKGPRDRTVQSGFGVAFDDLFAGRLTENNPDYFQYLDTLVEILIDHGICPVWNPVFHGFGWKGLGVAGPHIPPEEYARYCRYLVARYGAYPAMWLVCGDGHGYEPTVLAGGEEIEAWDAYQHPTGLHYGPHHSPNAHQHRRFVDFQWTQTGHQGEHRPDKVTAMWHEHPVKAATNGEPTYENIGELGKATGWWQGHEAWNNFMAGGVMGVVYGAGSLWNWVQPFDQEDEHPAWCRAPNLTWRDALEFEGSNYVGMMSKILDGLPLKGVVPDYSTTYGRRAVFKPDELLIVYLHNGGIHQVIRDDVPDKWRVYDPMTGVLVEEGSLTEEDRDIEDTGEGPRVIIHYDGF